MGLALLHTSLVHVPVFDGLRDLDHPGLELRHLVSEELLARARAEGPEAVAGDVARLMGEAVAAGATAVLCTCSTIGGVAEAAADALGVPALRVDRPMAARAAAADRIVVVASVASTLEPTVGLIREEAGSRTPRIATRLVEDAFELFEAGDREGYLDAVAAVVDAVPEDQAEVIVLAQASLADVAERVTTRRPVLSSPRSGLAAAAGVARG
ncbi:aspartate/glutamate racemase family protein [Streptomyces solicathayae]|uniref:Aspartate/glutamate racemase family protein n=1 Tax=Streptomyces solicathayae TaxID=3081768 RepID=A0ABZ0LMQ1_9ACTN|nr:aspartate/glutamate racemase family protein [Streptomyces sp. HUAS YS2]WOX20756.1 aspartate/glutamate racemase family protein [Streptomyces sp. HUAS YS2]